MGDTLPFNDAIGDNDTTGAIGSNVANVANGLIFTIDTIVAIGRQDEMMCRLNFQARLWRPSHHTRLLWLSGVLTIGRSGKPPKICDIIMLI